MYDRVTDEGESMELEKRNSTLRDFFNEKADGYDDVHALLMDTKDALVDAVPEDAKNILDIGVGTGLELIGLFKKLPDARVTGIDMCENMLAILRTRPFADKVSIVQGDFFAVDYGSEYDVVISSSALHHFSAEDKLGLYKKIFASLRPGGEFINSDCIANTETEERDAFEAYVRADATEHVDTPLCRAKEEMLLRKAGFEILSVTDLANPIYKLIVARKNN